MAGTCCFTSIKGGVTKTTSSVNIAHDLAQAGRRVLVIDADHRCNSTLALLGSVQEERTGTFFDVMMERRPVSIATDEAVPIYDYATGSTGAKAYPNLVLE